MVHTHSHGSPALESLPLVLVGLLLAAYLGGVYLQRRRGHRWRAGRTLSFVAGAGLLTAGLWPSLHHFGLTDIRGHMIQHLLVGMFAPLGLVLGAPVTLLLRSLPTARSRRLVSVLKSRPLQWLSHPATAWFLNIGGMAGLYLTPLYRIMLTEPALHFLVHFHFLAAGYLFTWSVAGPDPGPHRPGFPTRLGFLFISIATHANLSKFMYAHGFPAGTPHPPEQIRTAARIMYYGGDLSELLLAVALFALAAPRSPRSGRKNRMYPK